VVIATGWGVRDIAAKCYKRAAGTDFTVPIATNSHLRVTVLCSKETAIFELRSEKASVWVFV
jgi:hypothetical protein